MNAHAGDLTSVVKPDEFPGLSGVRLLVHAAARRDIAAYVVRAGAEIDHVRIRIGHRHTAGRTEGYFAIRNRNPGGATVGRAKQSTAGHAHVESFGLRWHSGHRRHSTAARWPNQTIAKSIENGRIDLAQHRLPCSRLCVSGAGGNDESKNEKQALSNHVYSYDG